MENIPNINDFERCPVCGKLFDRSLLAEAFVHMHARIEVTDADRKIHGKEVNKKSRPDPDAT